MAATNHLTVLERYRVSAPPKTVGERTLTLTFMDLLNLSVYPVNRVYFYDLPHPTAHIIRTLVPNLLKYSLSVTLQHFFPYAGNLVMFPDDITKKPEIRHAEGDSIALTFAESSLDFDDLVGNHPRDRNKFHLLIPGLECPVQAWSSITRYGTDEVFLDSGSLPLYDRVIEYPAFSDLDESYMANQPPWIQVLEKMYQPRSSLVIQNDDRLVATFHLTQPQINLLKEWVLVQLPNLEYVSSFIIGCAYVWICMAKSRNRNIGEINKDEYDETTETFICYANLRTRLDPPVPETYFGNCVAPCITTAKTSTLLTTGSRGFLKAIEVIIKCIKETTVNSSKKDVIFKQAETWMQRTTSVRKPAICIARSSKFNAYDVDFGWGKPIKHEGIKINNSPDDVITIDATRESPHDLEFGLSLCAPQMSAFTNIFENEIESMRYLLENRGVLPTAKI